MQKPKQKKNVLFRLFFNRADERAYGRFAFFFDTLMTNWAGLFSSGAFYTAFLRLNDISMADVGIMTYMPIIANLSCIFAPFVFKSMKKRKTVLMCARITYFLFNLVGVALVPFLIKSSEARVFLMAFLLSLANVIWGLFVGGFADWELNFLPQDGTREEFYAYRSLICGIVSAGMQVLAGAVSTAIEATPPQTQNLFLFWLRIGGFLFILLDVLVFLRAKEYPYPQSDVQLRLKDVFTVPLKSKPFRSMLAVRALVLFSMGLTNSSWTYYLMDCGLGYSTLSFLSSINPILALVLTPLALRLFRRMGCVKNLYLYRVIETFIYLGFVFIVPKNVAWLYPVIFIIQQVVTVGVSIADINFSYLFMPEKDRLTYYSLYYSSATVASFLGAFVGAQYIIFTEGKSLSFLGIPFANVQLLMLLQAAGALLTVVVFSALLKCLHRAEQLTVNATNNL